MVVRIAQKTHTPQKTYFREWRKIRKLTQEQLAEMLGTTKSAISKIENGDNGWNDSILYAWAAAVNCTPSDLLSRDPYKAAADDLRSMLEKASADTREVIRRILKAG